MKAATTPATTRDVDRGKWRYRRGNQRQTDRETTYTGPSPRVQKGLGLETIDEARRESSPTRSAPSSEAGDGEVSERKPRDDEDEKYEVVVDGHPQEVTLGEALNGYVRQETFHRRLTELTALRNALEEDHQRQQANWQLMMQAKEAYENDVRTMMPPEPDWDHEFAINPHEAHRQQKIYQGLYAKLAQMSAGARADGADPRAGGG